MSLIRKAVGQTCINILVKIKISTKFIPSFGVIVVSQEVEKKFEKDTVFIPEVCSVLLQKSAVEISEVHSRNFRSAQKITYLLRTGILF